MSTSTFTVIGMTCDHCVRSVSEEVGKIDGHQKRLPATIVPFPHYDPEKTRVRS